MMNTSEPRTLVTHPELRSHHSLPYFKTLGEAPKSRLERLLSVFADVRAGEGVGTLLLALNVFLLLAGYSLMRPARDGLILDGGRRRSRVLFGGSAGGAAHGGRAVIWLARHARRRIRLIAIVMSFFSATLVGFYLGGQLGLREGVAFYIWLGLINVFIVSQFWAFANDLYTEGQGRRLFPFIGVGQSLGALDGSGGSRLRSCGALDYTPYTLMLLGALPPVGGAVDHAYRQPARDGTGRARGSRCRVGAARSRGRLRAGFQRSLSPLDCRPDRPAQHRQHDWQLPVEQVRPRGGGGPVWHGCGRRFSRSRQFLTAFFGSITATVNLVSFLLQFFVTSRVIRYSRRARVAVHLAGARARSITRSSRSRRSSPSCGSERFSRTAPTTPFRTRCGRRSSCRPHARRSTRPRRRSTRSSRVEAMCSPQASSCCPGAGLATQVFAVLNVGLDRRVAVGRRPDRQRAPKKTV